MKKEMYIYNMLVINQCNFYNFDYVKMPYFKKINIDLVNKIDIDLNNCSMIVNKIAKIFYNKKQKYICYTNGLQMEVNFKNILINIKKATREVDSKVLYRVSVGQGLLSFLRLNNHFVLHGTVIEKEGQATVILAPSGVGKTTISAKLLKYPNVNLVSDDKTVISFKTLDVLYGSNSIRIWDDSLKNIFPNVSKEYIYSANSNNNKKILDLSFINDRKKIRKIKISNLIFLELISNQDFFSFTNISKKEELFVETVKHIDEKDFLTSKEIKNAIRGIKKMIDFGVKGYKIKFNHDFNSTDFLIEKIYNIL